MTYSNKYCFGCKRTKPVDDFYVRPENGRLYTVCKPCHNLKVNGPKKRLPISTIMPFLREIIYRCGSQRKAAKRIGVAKTQLRNWLTVQETITKKCAKKIMDTLIQLRKENVHYIHEHQPGPKPYWLSVNDADAERKRQERAA